MRIMYEQDARELFEQKMNVFYKETAKLMKKLYPKSYELEFKEFLKENRIKLKNNENKEGANI